MYRITGISLLLFLVTGFYSQAQKRPRDHGIVIGVMKTGEKNAITDVEGVAVGHLTRIEGEDIRTGVTAIRPHGGNIFQDKVPAAVYVGNGFGKLAGSTQVRELGNIETPIILTNTLSVGKAVETLVSYTLSLEGNEHVRSVNAVVGETNDGWLNDIRTMVINSEDVLGAINSASTSNVEEGNVGAGTGTVCFGYKGGIGTSSRVLPSELGGYTVGVLVQSNFGGVLTIDGVPVGEELGKYYLSGSIENPDGSCMIIVATDAPLNDRNLERLAARAHLGLGRTGGIASNGSGDYIISFSTAREVRIPYRSTEPLADVSYLRNDEMTPLFMAVIEATEEAVINSLFAAETMDGRGGTVEELPVNEVLKILKRHRAIRR